MLIMILDRWGDSAKPVDVYFSTINAWRAMFSSLTFSSPTSG
jgi:hypothetical protein